MQPHLRAMTLAATLAATGTADAVDVSVTGLKLIVVDKLATASSAKAVFVTKDAAITKGAGTDPAAIEATLQVAYDAASGTFDLPQGAAWLVNKPSVAKYVNRLAPTGGAVKVGVVKPTHLLKVVAKSLGDEPIDISSAPSGNVYVAHTLVNGGDTIRHCTQFSACTHKLIAAGTGYKLVCRGNSTGDAACTAGAPSTTTSTTSTTLATTTTTSTLPPVAFRLTDLDLRDPRVFVSFIGCRDVTDTPLVGFSWNGDLGTAIATDGTDPDALLDLSILSIFTPLDQTPLAGGSFAYSDGDCTTPMVATSCTAVGAPLATSYANLGVGTCLSPDVGTTRPYAPAVTNATAPCFSSVAADLTIDLLGIPFTLRSAQFGATYSGAPASNLINGLLRGFVTETDAAATILPASFPLVGGLSLSSILPGGGGPGYSCSTNNDRDTGPGGASGWWFYFNFTAAEVPLTGP